ncbi:MAG: phosphoglyceromutase [Bacteroidetes bacterium]|jgi:hypothetical protein|nr:phosphoglyceromutase [Bacteroidota bacterium]
MNKVFLFSILICVYAIATGQSTANQQNYQNVILVTLDGFRWQELFGGAADSLLYNQKFTKNTEALVDSFYSDRPKVARKKLMPWFWSEMAEEGQIYGNRWLGNEVNCKNRFWFSYPGYNEILTGTTDPEINSNDSSPNPNVTVLEFVKDQLSLDQTEVAAFASWNVFPFIINEERSGIPVNAGFRPSTDTPLTEKEIFLNELQSLVPSPWSTVRLDAFTHGYMMEFLKKNHPRLVYIAYGETDDFGHDGRYDHYLQSARRTDAFLEDLWSYIQSDPYYRDQTTMIITTDHGRGHNPMEHWTSHGRIYKGSHEIWMAAIGNLIPHKGVVEKEMILFQDQIAASVAHCFGLTYSDSRLPSGDYVKQFFEK